MFGEHAVPLTGRNAILCSLKANQVVAQLQSSSCPCPWLSTWSSLETQHWETGVIMMAQLPPLPCPAEAPGMPVPGLGSETCLGSRFQSGGSNRNAEARKEGDLIWGHVRMEGDQV